MTDPRAYLADVLADLVEVRATWALDDELLIGSQAELASMSATVDTLARALLAVLELHPPYDFTDPLGRKFTFCTHCFADGGWSGAESVNYPCPTVQAITTELAKEIEHG